MVEIEAKRSAKRHLEMDRKLYKESEKLAARNPSG